MNTQSMKTAKPKFATAVIAASLRCDAVEEGAAAAVDDVNRLQPCRGEFRWRARM